jgi:methionyl-tRNA formyltransferase
MKIIFLGATKFSENLLNSLIVNEFEICAIFTIPKIFKAKGEHVVNYNYVDLSVIAENISVPCFEVDNGGKKLISYKKQIEALKPDIILVLGWYYLIPKEIRDIATYGACGIHASVLPNYAGWAPLVWAIIEGATETGVTFFQMDGSVDGGDIIAQARFEISKTDQIAEVYEKATEASRIILIENLPILGKIQFIKQNTENIKVYPQRKPEDGELDLRLPADSLYNFVRAQSSPYPGAFIRTSDGKKLIIEKVRIEE